MLIASVAVTKSDSVNKPSCRFRLTLRAYSWGDLTQVGGSVRRVRNARRVRRVRRVRRLRLIAWSRGVQDGRVKMESGKPRKWEVGSGKWAVVGVGERGVKCRGHASQFVATAGGSELAPLSSGGLGASTAAEVRVLWPLRMRVEDTRCIY